MPEKKKEKLSKAEKAAEKAAEIEVEKDDEPDLNSLLDMYLKYDIEKEEREKSKREEIEKSADDEEPESEKHPIPAIKPESHKPSGKRLIKSIEVRKKDDHPEDNSDESDESKDAEDPDTDGNEAESTESEKTENDKKKLPISKAYNYSYDDQLSLESGKEAEEEKEEKKKEKKKVEEAPQKEPEEPVEPEEKKTDSPKKSGFFKKPLFGKAKYVSAKEITEEKQNLRESFFAKKTGVPEAPAQTSKSIFTEVSVLVDKSTIKEEPVKTEEPETAVEPEVKEDTEKDTDMQKKEDSSEKQEEPAKNESAEEEKEEMKDSKEKIDNTVVFKPVKESGKKKKDKNYTGKYAAAEVKKPHYVARVVLCIFTALLMVIITVCSALFVISYGPSPTVRRICVMSAKQASATKWLPDLFLSAETIDSIMNAGDEVTADIVDIEDIPVETDKDEWADAIDGVKLIFRQEPNFKAYVLLVKDPSRVQLGISSENYATANGGMRIFDIAEKYHCLAAINGGEFSDPGGQGNGSQPIGITYQGGRCVWGGTGGTFIGLDKDNNLVCVEGMDKNKADSLGIRDGCCFMRNNVIIERDGNNVKLNYADDNLGIAQKTAIGQRADGTIIMIVTDGRSAESVGATRNDMIDLMVEYGAVVAGSLDGGSSSMMYYRDYFDAYGIDKNSLEEYQQMGLVNRYKAFTRPRRIPTFFIVMPGEES